MLGFGLNGSPASPAGRTPSAVLVPLTLGLSTTLLPCITHIALFSFGTCPSRPSSERPNFFECFGIFGVQWERNGEGSRLSDGLDPSVDPAGGSRVETSQSNILLEVGWKEVL